MSSPDLFHPEFGYLCPTSRLRRAVRIASLATAVGAAVGAVGTLALMQGPDPDRVRAEIALTSDLVASPSITAAPARTAAKPVVSGPLLVTLSASPCATQTWPFFDDKCLLGATRSVPVPTATIDQAPSAAAQFDTAFAGVDALGEAGPAPAAGAPDTAPTVSQSDAQSPPKTQSDPPRAVPTTARQHTARARTAPAPAPTAGRSSAYATIVGRSEEAATPAPKQRRQRWVDRRDRRRDRSDPNTRSAYATPSYGGEGRYDAYGQYNNYGGYRYEPRRDWRGWGYW